ncbi:MAG: molybdopterin molybdotransferase MoeA [Pseudomonadota bacterium]
MSGLISVDEAIAALVANRPDWPVETVALSDALGARLAIPLKANVTRPPAAVSAMDGYAVRLADVGAPDTPLKVIGDIPAGTVFDKPVSPGEAVRIFTGSELPTGADHVVMQEHATRDGDTVRFLSGYSEPSFVRAAGRDFSTGDTLIEAGAKIGPAEIAIAAAANHATLSIHKRPTIAILANGDELRAPGSTLERGQIVNSNPAGLSALISLWGGIPLDLGVATDSVAAIREKIDAATDADIILPVGGASVGDHDHMRAAFAEAGYDTIFEKIAVRPGKPTWFARKDRQLVLGLPGNPASAFVCAHLFLRILTTDQTKLGFQPARLEADLAANGSREAFLRATATYSAKDGSRTVISATDQDSSLIRPFLSGNCLIHRPANAAAQPAGSVVHTLPLTTS